MYTCTDLKNTFNKDLSFSGFILSSCSYHYHHHGPCVAFFRHVYITWQVNSIHIYANIERQNLLVMDMDSVSSLLCHCLLTKIKIVRNSLFLSLLCVLSTLWFVPTTYHHHHHHCLLIYHKNFVAYLLVIRFVFVIDLSLHTKQLPNSPHESNPNVL